MEPEEQPDLLGELLAAAAVGRARVSSLPMFDTAARRKTLALVVLSLLLASPLLAGGKPEAEWMAQLASPEEDKVVKALQGLEKEYPDSDAARAKTIEMLKDSREKVRRKAARVLGALHAKVDKKVLAEITPLLESPNKDTVLDGLKALRGLEAASTVPKIVPLLQSPDDNIKRDACRTLAEIADDKVIPKIEPLLNDPNKKVQEDARLAIARLKK